ncbi:MAG: hypothetical protein WAX77_09335 [Methylococcaceae bacterium]
MSGGKQLRERDSFPGRQSITQHLWRHHDHTKAPGTVEERLQAHDDLHWEARHSGGLGHTHQPFQEGETINDIARRYLDEGTAQQTAE